MLSDRPCSSFARLVLLCAALSTPIAAASAASSGALLDAGDLALRDDLAWLADRGRISLGLGTWPMPAAAVTAALAACRMGDESAADLDALARTRAARQRLD